MASSKSSSLTIIKIGGRLLAESLRDKLARELGRHLRKDASILVHGGGNEVTEFCKALRIRTRFVGGRRFTDAKTMEAVELILAGKVNPEWVSALRRAGVNAVGMTGRTAGSVTAQIVPGLGLVGKPERARTDFLKSLTRSGYVPVFAPVAADQKGNALNINADDFASFLAVNLKAGRLVYFTDVPGILDGKSQTISGISPKSADELIRSGVVTGGMVPKLQSAVLALKKGVKEIWILQGKLPLKSARGTVISNAPKNAKQPFR